MIGWCKAGSSLDARIYKKQVRSRFKMRLKSRRRRTSNCRDSADVLSRGEADIRTYRRVSGSNARGKLASIRRLADAEALTSGCF